MNHQAERQGHASPKRLPRGGRNPARVTELEGAARCAELSGLDWVPLMTSGEARRVRLRGRLRVMASVVLSEAEKVYIVHGVQEDLRVDGRGCEDYRCTEVETDVVSNTSGSARVKLGHTDILVGVKAEMGVPKLDKPNEGYLEFFVDCSANATPEFEGRGGEELGTEIANTLYRIFKNESCVDLKLLCINPREHCWVLYVDVLGHTSKLPIDCSYRPTFSFLGLLGIWRHLCWSVVVICLMPSPLQ
ncbi:exosome complex component RRP42 isoform X3 [Varanus komodoensis]|uniref:exosome complex component RRP42 isoform X3 n=1 Tax=Varanus komodoensis TaxID=61221 RepID=UPI001CF79B99|nr:exosome complex component RRP42 isoform X3 [Varanus komodoensis]